VEQADASVEHGILSLWFPSFPNHFSFFFLPLIIFLQEFQGAILAFKSA
jgi:hypothetical protein